MLNVLPFESVIVMDTLNRVTRISFNYDAKTRGEDDGEEEAEDGKNGLRQNGLVSSSRAHRMNGVGV